MEYTITYTELQGVDVMASAKTKGKNGKSEKFKVAVGKRLRTYRKTLNLNVVTFAEKIKISQGTLSELENGISAPSAQTLANLYLFTDVGIGWLLTGREKR